MNKQKIINDPIHGFIKIPNDFIFDLVQLPVFQRLRRISQTALTSLVYPGANHTRFSHSLGCLHLMQSAIEILRSKDTYISDDEENAVCAAILLHDIGHGPFSHSLEACIIPGISHEEISIKIIERINDQLGGKLDLCLKIFKGEYHRKFFKQLLSSQIDIDRLDYLKRDSFYTGVVEGNINPDRLISMMVVKDDELLIEAKGIYSVEKFLLSRVFMHWQVYHHKTSKAIENYLKQTILRVRELIQNGKENYCVCSSQAMNYFIRKQEESLTNQDIEYFLALDDSDYWVTLKEWSKSIDKPLSMLCKIILNRVLPSCHISYQMPEESLLNSYRELSRSIVGEEGVKYFVHISILQIMPYNPLKDPIKILFKDQSISELTQAPQGILGKELVNSQSKYHISYLKQWEG